MWWVNAKCVAGAVGALLLGSACQKAEPPKPQAPAVQAAPNSELLKLFQEDQGDRKSGGQVKWDEIKTRDAQRRARVDEILAAGGAKTGADYFHAAMVFQHGSDVAAYQKAQKLALKAVELDPAHKNAKWMVAASKDRELMNLGKPQLYGTQMRQENGRWQVYQVDPSITDEERAKWNVPPLAEQLKRAEAMNGDGGMP